jgi:hypothetical protein
MDSSVEKNYIFQICAFNSNHILQMYPLVVPHNMCTIVPYFTSFFSLYVVNLVEPLHSIRLHLVTILTLVYSFIYI